MRRTSGADESVPEKRMRSAKSFPPENSPRKHKLFPNFYICNVIHEIRKQQRSEERYVRGASH
ncbi:hypothetical protein [Paenibacillus sp. NPDC093718]|uniref:hypothetical protein n=1 Tax=Paenibacillus sp. NPDC093718 TaxID=3390601 RepID=UPI003D05FEF1